MQHVLTPNVLDNDNSFSIWISCHEKVDNMEQTFLIFLVKHSLNTLGTNIIKAKWLT